MSRRLHSGLAVLLYFAIVVWFLRKAEPGSFCAYGGPSPPFWGEVAVTSREYFLHKSYYDALFFVPYLVVGTVITFCGCAIAPEVVRRFRTKTPAAVAFFSTLFALLLVAIASDICSRFRLWPVPLFLLHGSYDPFMILTLSRTFLPAAVMSALWNSVAPGNSE